MFKVHKFQMKAFSDAMYVRFEERMIVHIKTFFPSRRMDSEQELKELIRHGISRSSTYGIVTERDVCRYIDLMLVLGRDFDLDTRCSWAGAILQEAAQHPCSRLDQICDLVKADRKEPLSV